MRLRSLLVIIALGAAALSSCATQPTASPSPAATAAGTAGQPPAATSAPASSPTVAPAAAAAPTAPAKAAEAAKPAESAAKPTSASSEPTLKSVSTGNKLEGLTSYRQTWTFRDKSEGANPDSAQLTMTEEWVKDPPAQHIVMKGVTDQGALEMIQIGKDSYVNLGGDGWMKSTSDEGVKSMGVSDLGSWMRDSDYKLVLTGSETVNGVKTKHYTYDTSMPVRIEQGVTLKAKGEVWIADEAPLAGMAIKEKAEIEYVGRTPKPAAKGAAGMSSILSSTKASWERELSDVNKPITIKPPEKVLDLETMLTPQAAGTPRGTSTPRAAGTPAATGQRTPTAAPTARPTVAAGPAEKGSVSWTKVDTDAEGNLNKIVTLGNTGAFAFGEYAETLRLSGGKWQKIELPEANGITILDAQALDGKTVWAVGDQGLILHFDGAKWTRFQSPTEESIRAVGMASDTDGWAGGDNGVLLRFANGSWKSVDPSPLDPGETAMSILMTSATEGWIFTDGQTYKLKSGKWVDAQDEVGSDGALMHAAAVPGSKEIWALGTNEVWRFDGSAWSRSKLPGQPGGLAGIAFTSPTDGWLVGGNGAIMRWNGTAWTKWTSPSNNAFRSISIAPSGDAWIVGNGPVLLKLNR